MPTASSDRSETRPRRTWASTALGAATALAIVLGLHGAAPAQVFDVLYTFPQVGVIQPSTLIDGRDGMLYGTTFYGGRDACGTVFQFDPTTRVITTLFDRFYNPYFCLPSNLVRAQDGTFYGSTQGGPHPTVFKMDGTTHAVTILRFLETRDGYDSNTLVRGCPDPGDPASCVLYGIANAGGEHFYGTVFTTASTAPTTVPTGPADDPVPASDTASVTVLHSFNGTDGWPGGSSLRLAGLLKASDGFFYGVTTYGGDGFNPNLSGGGTYGTVFRIAADGSGFTTLHSFGHLNSSGVSTGAHPVVSLVENKATGTLYGTTVGNRGAGIPGTVFTIDLGAIPAPPAAAEVNVLHTFDPSTNASAEGGPIHLVEATDGYLYMTTSNSRIFRMSRDGSGFLLIHSATSAEGTDPNSLFQTINGAFYGTFGASSPGRGSIWSLHGAPSTTSEILVSSWEGRIARYAEGTGAYLGDFTTSSPLVSNEGVEYGPDGKLYVTEYWANRVRRFFPDGTLDPTFSCDVPIPFGITFDSAGNVYVSNSGNSLYRCAPDGTAMGTVGAGWLNAAVQPRMGPDGYIYVSNYSGQNVTRFRPDGSDPSVVVSVPGQPVGLDFAPNGDLYVSVYASNTIWRGNASQGLSLFASVPAPNGIRFSRTGDLIVGTGGYEGRFYRIHPDGTFDTVQTNLLVAPSVTVTVTPAPMPTITSFSPTSGDVGTPVTITGTNFTGTTAVRFNGTSASFTVDSATQITAVVPAGVTTGPIAVTTAGGGTATSGTSFAIAGTGNLYASFYGSNSVAEITPSGGSVAELVPSGSGGLSQTSNLRFGPDGHLYVAVTGTGSIKKYDGVTGAYLGDVVVTALGGQSGVTDLIFDTGGNIFVAESALERVSKYTSAGLFVRYYTDRLSGPYGLAWRTDGKLLVTNYARTYANTVTEIDVETGGGAAFGTGLAGGPVGIVAGPDGRYYVANYNANSVQVIPENGGAATTFVPPGTLSGASFLVFFDGGLYVASYSSNKVEVYDRSTGASLTSLSMTGIGAGIQGIAARGAVGGGPADMTPPVLALPDNITAEATSAAGAVVTFTATANDAIDGPRAVSCVPGLASTFPLGTTTVSCSASDSHGNTASGSFSVTVRDTTPPALALPGNITTEATSAAGAVVTYSVSATDTVDGALTPSCGPISGSTFAIGTTPVTCSATDAHGNPASGSFSVTVRDTAAPMVTVPGNITTEATSAAGAVVTYTATASDGIDGAVAVSCAPASGATFAVGPTTVTCSATDAHGNTGIGSFTVTVQDSTAPVLTLPGNMTVQATGPSGTVVTYTASASDAVNGPVTVSCSPASGGTFPIVTTTVSCSATDAHGNTATGSFTVTVTNATENTVTVVNPSFEDVQISCCFNNNPANVTGWTFTGDASTALIWRVGYSDSAGSITVAGDGMQFVTLGGRWTGSSGSGAVSQTLSGLTPGKTYVISFMIAAESTGANFYGETSTPITVGVSAGSSTPPQTYTATNTVGNYWREWLEKQYTFVASASSATIQFSTYQNWDWIGLDNVRLAELAAPTISGFSPTSGGAGTSVTITGTSFIGATAVEFNGAGAAFTVDSATQITATVPASATTGPLTVTTANGTATSASAFAILSPNLFVANYYGNTIEVFTPSGGGSVFASAGVIGPVGLAFDGAGNLFVANYGVNDGTTIAKLTPGGVASVFATGLSLPVGLAFDGTGDLYVSNIGNNTIMKFTPDGVGSLFAGTGLNNPYGLAFDSAGQLYVANFGDSTILKFTPGGVGSVFASAGLSAPQGLAFDSAGNLFATNHGNNTITKFTPGGVSSLFASGLDNPYGLAFDSAGDLYVANLYSTRIMKYTADGTPSLFATASSGSTFLAFAPSGSTPPQDTTPPVLTLPTTVTREATSGAGAAVSFTATASDAIDGLRPVSCAPSSGSVFALGATIVTCSASDTHANTATGSFTITVQDTTAPALAGVPADLTVEATSAAGAVVSFATPTAADLVDGSVVVTCVPGSGSTFALGATTVSCTATDGHGNRATRTFKVTVGDTGAPVLTLPASITVEATSPAGTVVSFTATADDIVDGARPVTCTPASGSTFPITTTTVSCSASDAQGNTSTGSFTVTVQDTTRPVLSVPGNITVEATSGAGAVVTYTATASDAIDGTVAVSCAPAPGATFAVGTTTVTCAASDSRGNTGTGGFTVTVLDTTAPTLSLPANMTVESALGAPVAVSFSATATDVVDGAVTVSCMPTSGSLFPLGSTSVSCSATDSHGNTASGSFTVTVQDTTSPGAPAITDGPASPTNKTTATFAFSDADANAIFLCAIDSNSAAAFTPCTSPQAYPIPPDSTLAAGAHVFYLKARDQAGNESPVVSFTWTIDLAAPAITLSGTPLDPSGSSSAAFSFFTNEASTFGCQLDGGAVEGCRPDPSAPGDPTKGTQTYAGLPAGPHLFTVTATDAAGNSASLGYSWTIDLTAPALTITSAPFNPTNSNTAGLAFSASEPSTFRCQLVGPASYGPEACGSTLSTTGTRSYVGLGEGSYTFTVTARDAATNATSAAYSWVVDQTPPSITFGIPSPVPNANGWNSTSVSIPFTVSDPSGIATATPASPLVLSSEGASVTAQVTATDGAGNTATAISPAVKIDRTPPTVTITTPAGGATYTAGQAVSAGYTCADALSGVASCVGPVPSGSSISTASAGNFTFTVTSVDRAGNSTSRSVSYSVNANTTTTITSSLFAATVVGQPYTVSVSVAATPPGSGIPTGSVTVSDGSASCSTPSLSGGSGSCSLTSTSAGTKTITASYNGAANFNPSVSAGRSHTVNRAGTSTAVASSANPSVVGQSVTFTATVTVSSPGSGTPSGPVIFNDGLTTLCNNATLTNGQATCTTSTSLSVPSTLRAGSHPITASYGGSGNFNGSTSAALTQTVNPAATTTAVSSSANPSVVGQSVTFTATVTVSSGGTPAVGGTVSFKDGTTTICNSVTLTSSRAACPAALSAGARSITASYSGSINFNASTSPVLTQTVSQASTATVVSSSVNPSVVGQSVTFTARVTVSGPGSGTPGGSVTFKDGGSTLGTATLSSGQGTITTAALSGGSHSVTASYGGSSSFAASTSAALTQTVNPASTTTVVGSSRNPSVVGQPVTFTAAVTASGPGSGTPTGTVTFRDGATTLGSGALNGFGQATFTPSSLSAGSHPITAGYDGSSNFNASTSAGLTQTVGKAATTTVVSSSANPSVVGQPVTFTATVAVSSPGGGIATGTVTFRDGLTILGSGTLNGAGQATFPTSTLSVGSRSITASYGGSSDFNASTSGAFAQTVNKAATTTIVSASANPSVVGQPVTFTATVTVSSPGGGTPTGPVIFRDGVTTLGTRAVNPAGVATFTTSSLGAGLHSVTASYGGSGSFNASASATLTQNVQ
jgi:uncharacterized repeat protein (TIGR03803 family)